LNRKTAKTEARADARPELDELLTISDVCAWWKVDRATLHRWRTRPEFPRPIVIGSSMRWSRAELLTYLADRRASSAVAPAPAGIKYDRKLDLKSERSLDCNSDDKS